MSCQMQLKCCQSLFDFQEDIVYNCKLKPRDFVAKDLRTPKYRMRVVESKVRHTRKIKHKGKHDAQYV